MEHYARVDHHPDLHVRYALRVGPERAEAQWVGHSGGCLGTPLTKFDGARIWVRRADAQRYVNHKNVVDVRKRLVVVNITCAVGKPYAIFTEAP